MSTTTRIRVGGPQAGPGAYDVIVGTQVLGELPSLLGSGVGRVLLLHQRALADTVTTVSDLLTQAGLEVIAAEIPDGEQGKTAAVLEACWARLGQAGFTRNDAIVGLGGGAATDLAGFVAATWLRGVAVVQIPTTLLGMVDAAVGGKTGINTAEGKNLVGSFHPPAGVIADLAALQTLPQADLVAGLGEVVKCGFIADPVITSLIEQHGSAVAAWDSPVLRELVERSIAVKAHVVTDDLTESGLREILNYGHTFGHAIEKVERYTMRHGEAVSIGMMYAAELGRLAGITPATLVQAQREVLTSLGLPLTYRPDRWAALLAAMRVDKKSRGSMLRFVVLAGPGEPQRLEGPSPELLLQAYEAVSG